MIVHCNKNDTNVRIFSSSNIRQVKLDRATTIIPYSANNFATRERSFSKRFARTRVPVDAIRFQPRFSIVAIDSSDGICVEVFEQWYPLKNTSAASGDKWHAILWLLPLTRVYRGVPRANATSHNVGVILRAVCRASGKNTRAPSSDAALRPLNK